MDQPERGTRGVALIAQRRLTDPAYDAAIVAVWAASATGRYGDDHPLAYFVFALGPEGAVLDGVAAANPRRAADLVEVGRDELGMHDPTPWQALQESVSASVLHKVNDKPN